MKNILCSPKSLLIRCLIILVGILFSSFGISCFLVADLGSDPATVFVQGMGNVLSLGVGMAMNVYNLCCFVAVLLLNRKLISIGTVMYAFLLGTAIDFWNCALLLFLALFPSLWVRIVVLAIGTVALGVGLGVYQSVKLGAGPCDALNQALAARFKIPLKWERMGFDAVMMLGGWLMGGNVFWATLVGMLAVGPIMSHVMETLSVKIDQHLR